MVKHVYYKKQATDCTWHLLSKMEREKRLLVRRQQERERSNEKRKALLMVEYIRIKHPSIYDEASEYYEALNEEYFDKHDLRKLEQVKRLKRNTHNSKVYKDNMLLNIPLIGINSSAERIQPETTEAAERIQPETTEAAERIQPETTEAAERIQPETTEAAERIQPETTEAAERIQPETTEAAERIQPEATEAAERIQPETTEGIQPTLLEPIPSEALEQVINELRLDPFFGQFMNEVEEDFTLDIDLEIDDDLLEKELVHW